MHRDYEIIIDNCKIDELNLNIQNAYNEILPKYVYKLNVRNSEIKSRNTRGRQLEINQS